MQSPEVLWSLVDLFPAKKLWLGVWSCVINKVRYKPGDGELESAIFDSSLKGTAVKFYNGGMITITKLAKTDEFGGQSKSKSEGGGGFQGKATEVLSETAFCFYYALVVTGN